jgi:hypothetical protein
VRRDSKPNGKTAGRARPVETSLYAPVKAFLEGQGYEVKGEVGSCDVVAVRADALVIVELKTRLTLDLLLQGVERLAATDTVYIAVPSPRGASVDRRLRKLLRRLGLGLLLVDPARARGRVDVVLDPLPYRPRPNKRRAVRLLGEFARRVGDPNQGGSRGKLVTAYRQEALRIASVLQAHGAQRPAALRQSAEAPKAARILQDDVYGWFERVARGLYRLTPTGAQALALYAGRFAAPASLATIANPSEAAAQ